MMDVVKVATRRAKNTVHVYNTYRLRRARLPQVPLPYRPPLLIFNIHKAIATLRPTSQRPRNPELCNLALTLLLLLPALLHQPKPLKPLSLNLVCPLLLDQLQHRVPALKLGTVEESRGGNARRNQRRDV